MIEVEIAPDQLHKLELIAAHRKADVAGLSDIGGGRRLVQVRKR